MQDEQEYVYAIAHPHGFVKIGRSNDPQSRLRQHQTSCPYELWIVAQIPVIDSREVEAELHSYLDEKQVRGEWYDLDHDDYDDLFEMVKMAASDYEFNTVDEFRAWQARKREAML